MSSAQQIPIPNISSSEAEPVDPAPGPHRGRFVGLSHVEATEVLDATGRLIGELLGQPVATIGIARSGTAFGQTVALASDSLSFVVVGGSRVTSAGWRGTARAGLQRVIPDAARRAYKSSLYPLAIRAAARQDETRTLAPEELAALAEVLVDGVDGPVVIVDDSIDTGKTVDLVRRAVLARRPGATVVTVALNSTIGVVSGDHQLTLVHGAHVENTDGDPSEMHVTGPPVRYRRDRPPTPIGRPDRYRLYLDLDHTLCRGNSFTMAARLLVGLARRDPRHPANRRYLAAAAGRRGRLTDHLQFKQEVDRRIRSLSIEQNLWFQNQLAEELRSDVRPALFAVGRAASVDAAVVTAALASYRPAIEKAFGLPVLSGAGWRTDGQWLEPGGLDKRSAIEADLGAVDPSRALIVGDSLVDLLSAGRVAAVAVPAEDTSGLATILAARHWWDGSNSSRRL